MKTIDFSPAHDIMLKNPDGTLTPMDMPYYIDEMIAPNTWAVISDGDYQYLLIGEREGLVIDTGCGAGDLRAHMQGLAGDVPVLKAANTHHHFDHSGNNCNFDLVYMHEAAVGLAFRPFRSYSILDVPTDYNIEVIKEGDTIDLGGRVLEIFHMDGHASSSLLYLDKYSRILFSGDEITTHGMEAPVSVEHTRDQLAKIMEHREDFDYICCGSHSHFDAKYIDTYFEICTRILAGEEGKPMEKRGAPPKRELEKTEDGKVIYERKKPRMTDMGGGMPEKSPVEAARDKERENDAQYRRRFDLGGTWLNYDIRKIR